MKMAPIVHLKKQNAHKEQLNCAKSKPMSEDNAEGEC